MTASAPLPSREAAIDTPGVEPTTAAVTVLIITYSPGPVLEPLIESLGTATERPVRVILVDNGSTDGAPEAAAERYDNVELLPAGSNLGYGRAANLGAAR
ncbi:MAG TPA: glycosyltransferase, partial [Mycobacteriales bacterium]|nr:glycosyltransferase [Mycobacteriales bacterium]